MIGNGDPKYFNEFRKETGFAGNLFTNPSLDIFTELEFPNSIKGLIGLKAVTNAFGAMKKGFRQSASIQGSTKQLGGAITIDPDGNILYYYASKKAGDHPPVSDLLYSTES